MNDEDIRAYQQGPAEFHRHIMGFERRQSDIDNLLKQKDTVFAQIEKKHCRSNLNYNFPRTLEESSCSSHPSLAQPEYNLSSQPVAVECHTRKIMNLKRIREIVLGRDSQNQAHPKQHTKQHESSQMTTTTKKDFSKRNADSSFHNNISPVRGFDSRSRKIHVVSVERKRVRGFNTNNTEGDITKSQQKVRKEEHMHELMDRCSRDKQSRFRFNCCEQEVDETPFPLKHNIKDLSLEKRSIKVITARESQKQRSLHKSKQPDKMARGQQLLTLSFEKPI